MCSSWFVFFSADAEAYLARALKSGFILSYYFVLGGMLRIV